MTSDDVIDYIANAEREHGSPVKVVDSDGKGVGLTTQTMPNGETVIVFY